MGQKKIYSIRRNWVESSSWEDILKLRVISKEGILLGILDDIKEYDLGRNAKGDKIPLIEVYFQEDVKTRYYVRKRTSTIRAFLAFREGAEKVPLVVLGEISSVDLASASALASRGIYNVGDLERIVKEEENKN